MTKALRQLIGAINVALVGLLLPLSLLSQEPQLDQARQLLDAGRIQEALSVLEPLMRQHPDQATALMLRSTAYLMAGNNSAGRQDLEHSLAVDPRQRQGWLNLAGLEIVEKNYDAALAALQKAEKLDPSATDNGLNLGAVHLLRGDLDSARQRFDLYLRQERSAEAFYVVAINYDGSGYRKLALAHLQRAIGLDERMRVQAANDKSFSHRFDDQEFVTLVTTDVHRLATDSHRAARTFGKLPYRRDGILLKAVLQTLQLSGRPLDPRVEVQSEWALMWSDARLKIRQLPEGLGRVEMTAPAKRFTPEAWKLYTEKFYQEVAARLLVLEVKQNKESR